MPKNGSGKCSIAAYLSSNFLILWHVIVYKQVCPSKSFMNVSLVPPELSSGSILWCTAFAGLCPCRYHSFLADALHGGCGNQAWMPKAGSFHTLIHGDGFWVSGGLGWAYIHQPLPYAVEPVAEAGQHEAAGRHEASLQPSLLSLGWTNEGTSSASHTSSPIYRTPPF